MANHYLARPSSDIDPFSPEFRADPFSHYRRLRDLGPLVWLEKYGIWCASHYHVIRDVLSNWQDYSNAGGGGLSNYFKTKPWRPPSLILDVDPPEHTRTRRILMGVFSASTIKRMHGDFAQVARQLVEGALAGGTIEAIEALVAPFPLKVFPDAVGMKELDRSTMVTYGGIVFGAFGPPTDWYHQLMEQAPSVSRWIDERCERGALTGDGLGAAIYAAHDSGEITYAEARLLVRSLLSAGVDTTIDSIGLALNCLAQAPDQYALLREDPGLARAMFEEATRFDASSQSLFRTTLRAVDLAGHKVDKHEKVLLFIGSAGRDPAKWDNPDTFAIRRRVSGQMSYGWGIHGCVAQMMARLEGEVFFSTLATRVSAIESDGPAQLRLVPGLRGLTSLPLAFRA